MTTLTKKAFGELAAVQQPHCISIFLPTHHQGQAVLKHEDALALKYQLKLAGEALEAEGMSAADVQKVLDPLYARVEDTSFWRFQSAGLACFLADQFLEIYALPFPVEAKFYLGNTFFLQPVLPLFSDDGAFFILTLELDRVHFFRANRFKIQEVDVRSLIPAALEEVVGYDIEEKTLQFTSIPGASRQGAYHGQGEGKDDRKEEIQRYFRAIDKGLHTILHQESAPLLLVCTRAFFPMYKAVCQYKNLYPQFLAWEHAFEVPSVMQEKAWSLIAPYFDQNRQTQFNKFLELQDTPHVSAQISEIIPAALYGKIDTLFIENQAEIWGTYDPTTAKVHVDKTRRAAAVSLADMAAIHTINQGGTVYLLNKEEMPTLGAKMCAVYRY